MSRVLRAATIFAVVSSGLSSAHGQTASCPTVQPAPDWVCIAGGEWVPPDHPLAIGAPGPPPPPSPSTSCTTVQPAPDWVCVNGGEWVPPDHPLAMGQTVTPALLMADGPYVASVRDSLRRGEPRFITALNALQAEADRVLVIAPVSVMDKRVTPPSGDKHDYMSQAPYWWPDPSKPGGKPYIRRDGQRNPAIKKITDHDNLFRVASAVNTLGLAYYFTGREDYAQHAAEFVRTWFLSPATRMNPNLNFAQGIPGRFDGRPAGIIESRRLPVILDGITLLQGSPAWTAADQQGLEDWMRAYLQWLLDSPNGRKEALSNNNQETWYYLQVVTLAMYTGQPEIVQTIFATLPDDIDQEFKPDGRQPEELARADAWRYSIFNLVPWLHLAFLGSDVGADLWTYRAADGSSLRAGVEFMIPFALGEKRFTYQKPAGGTTRPSELHPVLRWAGVVANDPRYRQLARQVGGGNARLALTLP